MIQEFEGKKWRCVGTRIARDEYGDQVEKPDFRMTRQYAKYCHEKARQKAYDEIVLQIRNVTAQQERYGDVDPVDMDHLQFLIQDYNKHYGAL